MTLDEAKAIIDRQNRANMAQVQIMRESLMRSRTADAFYGEFPNLPDLAKAVVITELSAFVTKVIEEKIVVAESILDRLFAEYRANTWRPFDAPH
jgi:hypothetical protein